MDKNQLFTVILIIIFCIIIYLYYSKKIANKYGSEKFNIENKKALPIYDNDTPNFVQDYINGTNNSSPNYKFENVTQYNYEKIVETIKEINKKKEIHLKGKTNYNSYTQSTTDDKLRMDLDAISERVVPILNNNFYDFRKTNYGDVEVHVDKYGNEEIKYEIFLWDVKNFFEIKLWVHVIKFIEKTNMDIYGIENKKYIFPYYNIGMDSKDQMIPSPTDVIISAHFDLSTTSIKPNVPEKIRYLYLNKIEIQNSTLIVDYQKDKFPENRFQVSELPNHFSGVTDMSLEYVNIKTPVDSGPYLERGLQYNKWPTLNEEPKWKGQFPSKPMPFHWDMDGLYYYGKKDEKPNDDGKCGTYNPGVRSSPMAEPLQPYFWPSNYSVPRNCGEYGSLFALSNGISDGSVFVGGGKM